MEHAEIFIEKKHNAKCGLALSSTSLIPGLPSRFYHAACEICNKALKSCGGLGTHLPHITEAGWFAVGSEPIEVEHLLQMALLCLVCRHYNEISTTPQTDYLEKHIPPGY